MDKFTDSAEFNKAVSPIIKELWAQAWISFDKIQKSEQESINLFNKDQLNNSGTVTIRR